MANSWFKIQLYSHETECVTYLTSSICDKSTMKLEINDSDRFSQGLSTDIKEVATIFEKKEVTACPVAVTRLVAVPCRCM